MLFINSDVMFNKKIIRKIINEDSNVAFVVDKKKCVDEDYKVITEKDTIVDMGKDLDNNSVAGEFIGIAKICGAFYVIPFIAKITSMVNNGEINSWFETAFRRLTKDDIMFNIKACYTDGQYWTEIDTIEDYNNAKIHYEG